MKITQNRVFKLASNTKTLRILNHHFKDDFKVLWERRSIKYSPVAMKKSHRSSDGSGVVDDTGSLRGTPLND